MTNVRYYAAPAVGGRVTHHTQSIRPSIRLSDCLSRACT